MTVELTQEQEQLIKGLIESGRYKDDRAVLSQSLKLIREYESRLSYLRAEIQRGEDSGDYKPLDVNAILKEARERREQRELP